MKQEPFVIERVFDAAVKNVWQAITDKEQMKQWYFNIPEFRPEPGFEFTFTGESDGCTYIHHCKVTEVIPHKKLSYSWRYEGHEGLSHVSFELFAEGESSTRVKLTHEGLETFPQDKKDFRTESFSAGWEYIIGTSLKGFLEKTSINKQS